MLAVSILSDSRPRARAIERELMGVFQPQLLDFNRELDLTTPELLIVDIDLNHHSRLPPLRRELQCRPHTSTTVFIADPGNHRQQTQAWALGATAIIHRPVQRAALIKTLLGDIEGLARRGFADAADVSRGVSSSVTVLQDIFGSVCLGAPLQSEIIDRAGLAVMSDIASLGLAPWIECVRKHHSQTYQHCLLVAGTAVAFAQQLGFSKADQQKLSFAALLHDVGKASIPITILEKPGPLDASELAVMRQHPSFGFETLREAHDIPAEMMDMVLHHHEYLDGSGYPDGLRARQIPDLVRIMTISDIFGALMERRAYKAPLTAEAAYQIMTEMNGKLDPDLLREFSAVAHLQRVH